MIDRDTYPKHVDPLPLALLPPPRHTGHKVIEAAPQGFWVWKGGAASDEVPVHGPQLVELKMNKIHI